MARSGMVSMQEMWLNALRFRTPQIRERWSSLLQAEAVTTPLANPHAMVHIIPWTLEAVLGRPTNPVARRRSPGV